MVICYIIEGGWDGSARLSSTELLQDNSWQDSVDLPTPVSGHCLVKLNSSHVFLAGGYGDGLKFSASYIYSRASGFIRQSDMATPRAPWHHGCALHGDNVWVALGDGSGKSSEYFSLSTSTWLPGPDLASYTNEAKLFITNGVLSLIGRWKIWQLETTGGDSADDWRWAGVGEMRGYRRLFDAFKIKQKGCMTWRM